MAQCPLCGSRKAKRTCPALGRSICAVCCGTKRQREIACPSDCGWLAAAGAHPPAVVQRRLDRDVEFLLPLGRELTEPQFHLLLLFQEVALQHASAALPPLTDADVADAAEAVAATLETAGKGIIYQHHAASMPAQRLAAVFDEAVRGVSTRAGAHVSAIQRDTSVALRQLAKGARTAAAALSGDDAPVFLNLLARVVRPSPQRPDEPEQPGSGLVITG